MKAKNIFRSFMMLAAAGTVITVSSCSKDDDTTPPKTNTITDVVVGNANFSVLKEAVVKAGLDGTLKGAGPFTVFAPDNAAFAAAGITSATVTATSADDLKKLLLYHTLAAKVLAADVPAGPNAKVTTANTPGDSIFVTRNASGVFVNGIKVAAADIAADNGVIHQLSVALKPAAGDIVVTADAVKGGDNGLDSLVVAILRANNGPGGVPTLVNTLKTATLTVFAPTNKAFRDVLAALSLQRIEQIPMATLLAVLQYHVVGGRAFSSDLRAGALPMLASGSTTVALSGGTNNGPTIKGNGNGTNASNIIATNVLCRNGAVHVIDRVLLP
jgi:uncharacterized surface protein with fasciclin (FAS1) repeats